MDNTCQVCGRSDCQCPSNAEIVRLKTANATLQQQVDELKGRLTRSEMECASLITHRNQLKQANKERDQLKQALEKLSKLGSEPFLGNSEGNVIAQEALKHLSQ